MQVEPVICRCCGRPMRACEPKLAIEGRVPAPFFKCEGCGLISGERVWPSPWERPARGDSSPLKGRRR